jgi:histidinol dehydrogenase
MADRSGLPVRGSGAEAAGDESILVYPVLSRRSGGLSLGINLFPYSKVCSFDCPYCEVFVPAKTPADHAPGAVSMEKLEAELVRFLDRTWKETWAPEPVRDICFSGNGEPTLSPCLGDALAVCDRIRGRRPGLLGGSNLVLITNSTGFFNPTVCDLLEHAVDEYGLEIWAKLDAGSEELFHLMSGSNSSLADTAEAILAFSSRSPLVIQSMFCTVDDRTPGDKDARELGELIASLGDRGARIRGIQVYTLARATPRGGCNALEDSSLYRLAGLVARSSGLPVRVFGSRAELGEGFGGILGTAEGVLGTAEGGSDAPEGGLDAPRRGDR